MQTKNCWQQSHSISPALILNALLNSLLNHYLTDNHYDSYAATNQLMAPQQEQRSCPDNSFVFRPAALTNSLVSDDEKQEHFSHVIGNHKQSVNHVREDQPLLYVCVTNYNVFLTQPNCPARKGEINLRSFDSTTYLKTDHQPLFISPGSVNGDGRPTKNDNKCTSGIKRLCHALRRIARSRIWVIKETVAYYLCQTQSRENWTGTACYREVPSSTDSNVEFLFVPRTASQATACDGLTYGIIYGKHRVDTDANTLPLFRG